MHISVNRIRGILISDPAFEAFSIPVSSVGGESKGALQL